jgi:hypothetical protein
VVLDAVLKLIANYQHYHRRALQAGRDLQRRNNANLLFQAITT